MSISRARDLRTNMTDAERRLWQVLRSRQLAGLRFRRPFHIGHYIADFACPAVRLVVEVDGWTHDDARYDAARDAWMQSEGWKVLRVSNTDVAENLEGVFRAIQQAMAGAESRIRKHPHPDPPP